MSKKVSSQSNIVKDKEVYIVVSKTSTIPSQVIKMWTREQYAHTSLALDIELNNMYSFARKKLWNPFYCGFIQEDITKGVFGRDVGTTCRVGRLRVTSAQYKRIEEIIERFRQNKDSYGYNYLGVLGVTVNKPVEREHYYFCSQFVYYVLQKAGVKMFDKQPGLARPEDFRVWDELEIVYEGKLVDYRDYIHSLKDKESEDVELEMGVNEAAITV